MDENDHIPILFPTHRISFVFHSEDIDMQGVSEEYIMQCIRLGMDMGLKPLMVVGELVPPMKTCAHGVEDAVSIWSGDAS